MKKLVLVLVLVLVLALPVLANPFVDVPLNHWAYDSVQSLAAKGVIVGYPDGTFGGGRTMTRYEFAEATAKALAYVEGMDFASAEDVAILEKLAIEFADELASLGVTVADLEAALGANSEAIAALETTVAKLDTFFEPVVISGTFTADYTKVVVPMTVATLSDETEINIVATINDATTAGITVTATDVLSGAPAYAVAWSGFFIDYQGADLQLRVGNVEPATIGLGLVFDSDDFDGFLATWVWDTENDLGDWTLFGDVEDYYTANIGFALGDEDEVTVGITGSYDVLAVGYAGSADVAFALGDADETAIAVEAGVFYGTTLTYAGALTIDTALDDLALSIDAHYVTAGFVPTMSAFTADTFGGGVSASYPLTDELGATLSWTYDMDTAMAVQTHEVEVDLLYTVDADTEETAGLTVGYDILTAIATIGANYMNYPFADDFVLSGKVAYDYPAATYAGVATLEYALATDMALTVEGRVDSDGAAFWSAEAQLVYTLDTNTALTVGFEMNDWDDDINDYDDMVISGTAGTLTAGLEVTF
ncbi:MAG: S-layer homology domain-containing protein [Candidatus Atribacteria bacterium]|nr:S-layer homology domain-containing protein [bacterium]MCG2761598.1 S-layer homology domain-containing protein [Candidatus Atribacteria bacterium]